jgi:drug/metabolite transporter (DMT)-like permease
MERVKGMFLLTGAFALAGSSVVAARSVAGSLGTFTIAAASLFFAAICLLPACGGRLAAATRGMKPKDWLQPVMQAAFGIFLFRLFLLQGLNLTSTGEAGILTGATPAITSVLAAVMLRETLYRSRIAGLCATVAGILLLQGLPFLDGRFGQAHIAGNLLVLCAAACEALFNVLSRLGFIADAQREKRTDPLLQTALVTCIAFVLCGIPAFFEKPLLPLLRLSMEQWLALFWYGAAVTALAFFFWYAGIKRCEASIAAVFSGMMPLTSLLLSVALLGERPVLHQYIGGLLIILGMVVSGHKKGVSGPDAMKAEALPDSPR